MARTDRKADGLFLDQQVQAEVRWAKADERWKQSDERSKQLDERWGRTEEGIRSLLVIAEIHEREIEQLREAGLATDQSLKAFVRLAVRLMND